MELYDNIKRYRLALKMTQQELADFTGYGDRSSIAKIEKGQVDLSQSKLELFAKVLHVTPGDLMGDVARDIDPDPLTKEETQLIDKYRSLNAEGQEKLLDYADDLSGMNKYKKCYSDKMVEKEA